MCRSQPIARISVAGSGSSVRWLDRSLCFDAGRLRLRQARPDALVQPRERRIVAAAVEAGERVAQHFGKQGHGLPGLVDERAVRARREHEDRDGKADNTAKCDLEHPVGGGDERVDVARACQ